MCRGTGADTVNKARKIVESARNLRHSAIPLLWRALTGRGGTSLGLVRCLPPRYMPEAENTKPYYVELLATARQESSPYEPIARRILIVSSTLGPGGAERQLVNTTTSLQQGGYDVHYCGLWLEAAPGNDFHLPRIKESGSRAAGLERRLSVTRRGVAVARPRTAEVLSHMSAYMLDVILNMVEELRAARPEIVHSWLDETNVQVGIAAVIAGVPRIVLSSRSVAPYHFPFHQPYMRPAYQALLQMPNVTLLNNSGAGAQSYADWLGVAPSAIRVIRNGVDMAGHRRADDDRIGAIKSALGIPVDAPVLGTIFRIGPEKRPRLWVDIAAALARQLPGLHFLVVGDGSERQNMEAHAGACGLQARFHFAGVRKDVDDMLSVMDVFLLTSEVEGLPNVLIEAQWLGVPVVTTKAGGAGEAIDPGETGWLVDSAQPEALASPIHDLLCHSERRRKIRDLGPAFIAARFGVGRMVDETLDAYGLTTG